MSLSPEEWDRIGSELERLVLLDAEARQLELEHLRRREPALISEILSLLSAHEASDEFLEKPAIAGDWSLLSALLPGAQLGEYRIQRLLGQGSFAQVFLAHDQKLNRPVALKVSSNYGQEARTMAALEHPGIVRVFSESVDSDKQLRWVAMQYVRGVSLEDVLSEMQQRPGWKPTGSEILSLLRVRLSAFPEETVELRGDSRRLEIEDLDFEEWLLWLVSRVAAALDFAHSRGVTHLDVKPANILLDRTGRPLLTDFNVSLTSELAEKVALLGGTRRYMSPEQGRLFDQMSRQENISTRPSSEPPDPGTVLDGRSDVYALGVVISDFLEFTRSPSVDSKTDNSQSDLEWLATSCQRADPNERFASAGELAGLARRLLHSRQLNQTLPPMGWIAQCTARFPFIAAGVFVFLPELAGSVINITYNSIWIVNRLTADEQKLFAELVLAYNVVIYPLTALYLGFIFLPLWEVLRASPGQVLSWSKEKQRLRTDQAIAFLPKAFVTTAVGWLPGILFFPGLLQVLSGPPGASTYFHFAVSFALSWLVAATYSLVYIQYMVLRLVYPKLFVTQQDSAWQNSNSTGVRWLKLPTFAGCAAITPLVGALLVLLIRSIEMAVAHIELVRLLLGVQIGLGILGIAIVLNLTGKLQLITRAIFSSEN